MHIRKVDERDHWVVVAIVEKVRDKSSHSDRILTLPQAADGTIPTQKLPFPHHAVNVANL